MSGDPIDVTSQAEFRRRWTALADLLGRVDASGWAAAGEDLARRHGEPVRRYHGHAHVVAVLDVLSDLGRGHKSVPAALQLAAFFHDAIYDPAAADNELASAVLARQQLNRLWIDTNLISDVTSIIEATANHEPVLTPGCELFLDADLSILGAPSAVYDRYVVNIRSEYAHVPADAFRTGRSVILQRFLNRDRLFFTEAGAVRFEAQARENLRRELAALAE